MSENYRVRGFQSIPLRLKLLFVFVFASVSVKEQPYQKLGLTDHKSGF
jgi:hypothetical protein